MTLDPQILAFAVELAEAMLARFHDSTNGGFWQTPPDSRDLILHTKEDSDGAEPSGNAVAATTLLRLAVITGQSDYKKAAARAIGIHAKRLRDNPEALPHLLLGAAFWLAAPARVIIAGEVLSPAGQALIHAAHADYHPELIILGTTGCVDTFARELPAVNEKPTAYVCIGNTCHPPTHDVEELRHNCND